ncbi:Bacteriophage CI repressor helix-turn-helix domain protein [compost metagenome]|jgi:phage terminase Nu1 subunit (DNA packaging protein)
MALSFDDAKEVLERIVVSYGAKNRGELAELLSVPLSTINNWVTRGSVPGNYVIQCTLETGANLSWLVTGKLANANSGVGSDTNPHGLELYERVLSSGGKAVLQRMLAAYGFTMQKQLGDLFGLSSGTISTWIRRDYFPGDVVVTCALDTGVNLKWLATGEGEIFNEAILHGHLREMEHLELFAGQLKKKGMWVADKSLVTEQIKTPAYVSRGKHSWIVDMDRLELSSGVLLLNIDKDIDVYNVSRLPGNQIKACNVDGGIEFTCHQNEVRSEGRVIVTLTSGL